MYYSKRNTIPNETRGTRVDNIFIFSYIEPRYDENGLNSLHKRGRKARLQVHTGLIRVRAQVCPLTMILQPNTWLT